MKRLPPGIALFALILGLSGPMAFADGKVFPPVAHPVEVRIPDQKALLWWSNGTERLVIETRFTGQGTDFGWVVPLPSAPKVEAATRGLFPTLTHLLRPEIIHSPDGVFGFALIIGGLGWLLIQVRPGGRLRLTDWLACGACAAGLELYSVTMGIIAFGFLLWAVHRVRSGKEATFAIVSGMILSLLLGGLMAVPVFSKAGAVAARVGDVEILDRQFAGVFETTTITSREPAALRDWLNTNGYALPKEAESVIADYLREGWVFVASKVRRDSSPTQPGSLHPISFTFSAKEPVYPLRLTGVGNGKLDVDLFVFGPERAKAPGFVVRECRQPKYPPKTSLEDRRWGANDKMLPMAHEGLRAAAPDAAYVTRLRGTLTPDQMRQDAVIQWDGFSTHREVLYSAHGAFLTAMNWPFSVFCIFLLGVAAASSVKGVEPARYGRPILLVGIVATAASGGIYASLPVVPVKMEPRFSRLLVRNQYYMLLSAIDAGLDKKLPVTLQSVRTAIERNLQLDRTGDAGEPAELWIREEDSPFNYSLRDVGNGVEVLFHNKFGEVDEFSRIGDFSRIRIDPFPQRASVGR